MIDRSTATHSTSAPRQGRNRGRGGLSANAARRLRPGTHKATAAERTSPARAAIISACAVAVIVLLVGLPAVHNGFVQLDDRLYVNAKPASLGLSIEGIRLAFTSVTVYWHPLTWLSHELDADLFGPEPAGHHVTSILLHAFSAGLLCLLLTRLGAWSLYAAAGSLLWALHPLRVESFAWVAERKDVLCALFFVACIAQYLRYQSQPSRARYAMWLLWGGCALMSKPAAVSLPIVLLLLDLWPAPRPIPFRKLVAEKTPLAAMSAVVLFLTLLGQQAAGATHLVPQLSAGARLANATVSYARYLGMAFWPIGLACHYPYERYLPALWVLLAGALLAGISAATIVQWRRRPWLGVAWAWFVVTLLPSVGLVQSGRQSIADRFTHIPMMGLAIGAVWFVSEWAAAQRVRRVVAACAAGSLLVVLAFLTVRQIGYWHDSVTLFEHAISVVDSDYMRANLATALTAQGRYAEAEPHLEAAVRLAPDEYGYHHDLAALLSRLGRLDEAARESAAAVRLAPNNPSVVELAAVIALRRGLYSDALAGFGEAVRLGFDPTRVAGALNDAGASLASLGRPTEAEQLVRTAVELSPLLVQARRNLVLVLEDQGRREDAAEALRQAVRATGAQPQYQDLARQLRVESQ